MIAIENKDGAFRDGADLCGKPAEFFYEILSRQNNQVSHTAAKCRQHQRVTLTALFESRQITQQEFLVYEVMES